MPLPFLPAMLVALRAVGMTAGRAGLLAARELVRNPAARRTAFAAARGFRARQQQQEERQREPSPQAAAPADQQDAGPTTPDANTQAARDFYRRASKRYGTPRPSATQLRDFAVEEVQRRRQREEGAQETTGGLKRLAVQALATAAVAGSLRIALRSYEGGVRESAESLKLLNPQIAVAAARFQRLQLLLQVQRAQAVGGSTAALLEARGQLAQAQQPFGIEFQNFRNLFNTAFTRMQTGLIQFFDNMGLDDAMKATNKLLSDLLGIEIEKKGGGMQHAFRDFLRSTSQGRFPKSPTPAEMAAGGLERPRGR